MTLPHNRASLIDANGRPTRDWYDWFRRLGEIFDPKGTTFPSISLNNLSNTAISSPVDGDALVWDASIGRWVNGSAGSGSIAAYVSVTFDNGVLEIDDNSQCDVQIPYDMTITKVTLLANTSGSIVVDIWKDSYGNFPPTVADTITAASKPTISSAEKYQDSTLTGWTTTVSAGDTLRFNVDSCTTIRRCVVLIEGVKS